MRKEIDRYAEQPRQRSFERAVVRRSALERPRKCLGREVVGDRSSGAPAQVAVYRPVVAVEDEREQLRLGDGSCEDGAVRQLALLPHHLYAQEAEFVHAQPEEVQSRVLPAGPSSTN